MVQTAERRPTAAPAAPGPRSRERRREILAAASRVFRRRGLHATGMREIAAELGMHAGNLYYYFGNKQELLAFCQEETLVGLLDLAREVTGSDAGPAERLARLVEGHVVLVNEITPGSLAHLEVEALEGRWRRSVQSRRDAYERAVRELVAEGVAARVFRPVDPQVAAMAILGALNWTVKWFRAEGPRRASEIGADFAALLIRGLEARPEGASSAG